MCLSYTITLDSVTRNGFIICCRVYRAMLLPSSSLFRCLQTHMPSPGTLSDRFDNKRLLVSAHLDKLFEFKPISHQSLQALTAFVNTFKKNVVIIKALGVNDLASFLLFHMGSRVPVPNTVQLFESSTSPSTIPTFDKLLNFVQQRCRILENIKSSNKANGSAKPSDKFNVRSKTSVHKKSVFAVTTSTSTKSKSRSCLSCDKNDHNIY